MNKVGYLIKWEYGDRKGAQAQLAYSAENAMLLIAKSVAQRLKVPTADITTRVSKRWELHVKQKLKGLPESTGLL